MAAHADARRRTARLVAVLYDRNSLHAFRLLTNEIDRLES
jgi:hypothetical protein